MFLDLNYLWIGLGALLPSASSEMNIFWRASTALLPSVCPASDPILVYLSYDPTHCLPKVAVVGGGPSAPYLISWVIHNKSDKMKLESLLTSDKIISFQIITFAGYELFAIYMNQKDLLLHMPRSVGNFFY